MNKAQQKRFKSQYQQHINALNRQGKSKVTIDAYSRAVRRIATFFDRCPDRLTTNDLKDYFTSLVKSPSWSTVKIDRNGLQVCISKPDNTPRPAYKCTACGQPMSIIAFIPPAWRAG